MNRPIKFRVWDKNREKFHYDISEVIRNNTYANPKMDNVFNDYSSFIIEQFTGLLDKNGKEIYEGDILQKNGEDKYLCKFVIQPYGSAFRFENIVKKWDFGGYINEHLMIIGNIHENPELLDKQN